MATFSFGGWGLLNWCNILPSCSHFHTSWHPCWFMKDLQPCHMYGLHAGHSFGVGRDDTHFLGWNVESGSILRPLKVWYCYCYDQAWYRLVSARWVLKSVPARGRQAKPENRLGAQPRPVSLFGKGKYGNTSSDPSSDWSGYLYSQDLSPSSFRDQVFGDWHF